MRKVSFENPVMSCVVSKVTVGKMYSVCSALAKLFTKPKSDGQKRKRESACAELVTTEFHFLFWKNWKSSK